MSESKKLSKRQLTILEDLFTGELEEQAVLDKHAVPRSLYERWLADERFTDQLDRRIAHAYRQSRTILARNASRAARRLVELTGSGTGETARKACLDVIFPPHLAARNTPSDAPPVSQAPAPLPDLSPETASRLLAALAEQA